MQSVDTAGLDHIQVEMTYTVESQDPANIRIFPPSSKRPIEMPPTERYTVSVYDCRPIADELTLDVAGFQLLKRPTAFRDYYAPDKVREHYYPESAAMLKAATGAQAVFVFDHNVRNRARSERGEHGVRLPTDGAHNDYTMDSGPRRIREILAENNALEYGDHRTAIINIWRPIVGPVRDHPIAICDARTTQLADFIPTRIQHFAEEDLETPNLTGEIYSFRYGEAHRWFYVADMQPDEVLLLKCFDSLQDGRALFTGHSGFRHLACPPDTMPRESIELRTVVAYP